MAIKSNSFSLVWFRNDLRIRDNQALLQGLNQGKIAGMFWWDPEIWRESEPIHRKSVLSETVGQLKAEFAKTERKFFEIHLDLELGLDQLLDNIPFDKVFVNRAYDPYGMSQEKRLVNWAKNRDIAVALLDDLLLLPIDAVLKADKTPYTVFTPFYQKFLAELEQIKINTIASYDAFYGNSLEIIPGGLQHLDSIFFNRYNSLRDFPFQNATSCLSTALNLGMLGIRELWIHTAIQGSVEFRRSLVWREFFIRLLYYFPATQTQAFKPKYDRIPWRNNSEDFEKWKSGNTGYPIVDAGMRELKATGYMHGRIRMIAGSFLCKHLLIDWRWGEAYFAQMLTDYQHALNVGNWQWVSSSGADAAPYFRIFNPRTQLDKFDPDRIYVKKWISEFGTAAYPQEMIAHEKARERCLSVYKKALNEAF